MVPATYLLSVSGQQHALDAAPDDGTEAHGARHPVNHQLAEVKGLGAREAGLELGLLLVPVGYYSRLLAHLVVSTSVSTSVSMSARKYKCVSYLVIWHIRRSEVKGANHLLGDADDRHLVSGGHRCVYVCACVCADERACVSDDYDDYDDDDGSPEYYNDKPLRGQMTSWWARHGCTPRREACQWPSRRCRRRRAHRCGARCSYARTCSPGARAEERHD